jgi:hypothetical protein
MVAMKRHDEAEIADFFMAELRRGVGCAGFRILAEIEQPHIEGLVVGLSCCRKC